MNQYDKIIKLLREAGDRGINSLDKRSVAVQLPARIYYLKRPPYSLIIESVPIHDKFGSVNYVLKEKPNPIYKWDFEGNMAKRVLVNQLPIQQQMI